MLLCAITEHFRAETDRTVSALVFHRIRFLVLCTFRFYSLLFSVSRCFRNRTNDLRVKIKSVRMPEKDKESVWSEGSKENLNCDFVSDPVCISLDRTRSRKIQG